MSRLRCASSAPQVRAWAQMRLPSQRMEALGEASASSFPSSHAPNCKTAVYQFGSSLWAGEALGRAGKSCKAHWHDSCPDIELDIKETFGEEN